jgi:hypothetical protein
MDQPRPKLNRALWAVQGLWGVFFSQNGFGKICCLNRALWIQSAREVRWFEAIPQHLFVFIGVCEFLGGLGLILPALTGIKPRLTIAAGWGLTAVMVLAAGFHAVRGEYLFLPLNLFLACGAACVAYGRSVLVPVTAKTTEELKLRNGFVVLALLLIFDAAPPWFKLTNLR